MTKNNNSKIPVKVGGVFIDPLSRTPIVYIINEKQEIYIPIWIGFQEAHAIYYYLKKFLSPRPFTIELLYNILCKDLKCEIDHINVSDFAGGVFFADICFKDNKGKKFVRDARPSDAIGLALKSNSFIYLTKKVIDAFSPYDLEEFKKLYKHFKETQKDLDIFK